MKCFKNIYGADADNNRGMQVIDYEIESTDNDEICEKLYDRFISGEDTGKHNIFMYCHITDEEIEVEVDIEDYIDNLIKMAQNDDDLKEDDELQDWLKWLKIEVKEKINGKNTHIGYIETINKTDYIYDVNKNLIDTVYNNDFKVGKILSKLSKEAQNGK